MAHRQFPPEAKEFKRRVEAHITTGEWETNLPRRKTKLTFRNALEYDIEVKGPKLADSTRKMYQLSTSKAEDILGDADVNQLTEDTMLDLRQKLLENDGKPNAAIWLRHLGVLLNLAKRKKLIQENPITPDVKFRPPDEPVTCYTEVQLGNQLQTADAEGCEGLSDQMLFLVYSGFRSQESCSGKWSQVDFQRRIIRYWNQKGKRCEDQPMDAQFVEFLAALPHRYEPYVFRIRHKSGTQPCSASYQQDSRTC